MALLGFESSGEEGSHSGLGAFPSWLSFREIRKSRICNCKVKRILVCKQFLRAALMALLCQFCWLDLDGLEITLTLHSFIHSPHESSALA